MNDIEIKDCTTCRYKYLNLFTDKPCKKCNGFSKWKKTRIWSRK